MKSHFASLDASGAPLALDALVEWLYEVNLSALETERFARFHPDRYQRNLMHAGPAYHALVLCWRAGQRSPIHDHTGSACAVKVLRGTATETHFDLAPNGMVFATGSRILAAGELCASQDSDIHQISNLQADCQDLVTLHLYSPPLLAMNVFSLVDGAITRFFDPINEDFSGGSGI